jgi:hypothetical protein
VPPLRQDAVPARISILRSAICYRDCYRFGSKGVVFASRRSLIAGARAVSTNSALGIWQAARESPFRSGGEEFPEVDRDRETRVSRHFLPSRDTVLPVVMAAIVDVGGQAIRWRCITVYPRSERVGPFLAVIGGDRVPIGRDIALIGQAGTADAVAVGEGERWFGRVLWDTREGRKRFLAVPRGPFPSFPGGNRFLSMHRFPLFPRRFLLFPLIGKWETMDGVFEASETMETVSLSVIILPAKVIGP